MTDTARFPTRRLRRIHRQLERFVARLSPYATDPEAVAQLVHAVAHLEMEAERRARRERR